MQITVQEDQSCATISVLEGNVSDQSKLVGVLNGLPDLHMATRSVELRGRRSRYPSPRFTNDRRGKHYERRKRIAETRRNGKGSKK
jgi:hypothetical protein